MGKVRNGARGVLNALAKACRLSRLPGFRGAIVEILGASVAADFFLVWDPMCAFVEVLIGADNWFNQIDHVQEVSETEDIGAA